MEGEVLNFLKTYSAVVGDFPKGKNSIEEWEKFVSVEVYNGFNHLSGKNTEGVMLIYNCSKSAVFKINSGKEILLEKGAFLLVGESAEIVADFKETVAVGFIIKPEFFSKTMGIIGQEGAVYSYILSEISPKGSGYFTFTPADGSTDCLVESLIKSILIDNDGDYAMQNLTLGLIFLKLIKGASVVEKTSPKEDEIILKTVAYIDASFKNAKLGEVAKMLSISPVNLSKAIKKRLGVTFKNLLHEKRLSVAEKLIKNTDIPITEIIYFVGYENTNFFYKMFSKRYAVSPKEYRKKYFGIVL